MSYSREKFISNKDGLKMVRTSEVMELNCFQSNEDKLWRVYGWYSKDHKQGGFTFGSFKKETDAKEYMEEVAARMK